MEFTTDRLLIRYAEASDAQALLDIWNDFALSPYARLDKPHYTTVADTERMLLKFKEKRDSHEHMFFAVCLDGAMIGYFSVNRSGMWYELGYGLHSAYQGQGYAKEALNALMDTLRALGITQLAAGTGMESTPSVRLLESCGFKLTATEEVSFYRDENGNDIVFEGGVFRRALA